MILYHINERWEHYNIWFDWKREYDNAGSDSYSVYVFKMSKQKDRLQNGWNKNIP